MAAGRSAAACVGAFAGAFADGVSLALAGVDTEPIVRNVGVVDGRTLQRLEYWRSSQMVAPCMDHAIEAATRAGD